MHTKVYGKISGENFAEFGFLGAYNQDRGSSFERFYLGEMD
jgi:outer membrane protein insertion porin family